MSAKNNSSSQKVAIKTVLGTTKLAQTPEVKPTQPLPADLPLAEIKNPLGNFSEQTGAQFG